MKYGSTEKKTVKYREKRVYKKDRKPRRNLKQSLQTTGTFLFLVVHFASTWHHLYNRHILEERLLFCTKRLGELTGCRTIYNLITQKLLVSPAQVNSQSQISTF